MPPLGLERRHPGRPPKLAPLPSVTAAFDRDAAESEAVRDRVKPLHGLHPLKPLIREWLLELKVMGRSPRTIKWYEQKLDWYFSSGGVAECLDWMLIVSHRHSEGVLGEYCAHCNDERPHRNCGLRPPHSGASQSDGQAPLLEDARG